MIIFWSLYGFIDSRPNLKAGNMAERSPSFILIILIMIIQSNAEVSINQNVLQCYF